MSSRRLLLDNDAFILLSGAGILRETIELLGFAFEDARRLKELLFMLRKPSVSLRSYPADVLQRALEDCERVAALEDVPTDETFFTFAESDADVQDGEALLFGVAAEHGLYCLASNDKRAMRGVASDSALKPIRDAVRGRVVCLEAVIKKFILTHGPETAAQKLSTLAKLDKRSRSILSPAESGRPQDCLEGVNSWLNGLHKDMGEGFLYDP